MSAFVFALLSNLEGAISYLYDVLSTERLALSP